MMVRSIQTEITCEVENPSIQSKIFDIILHMFYIIKSFLQHI